MKGHATGGSAGTAPGAAGRDSLLGPGGHPFGYGPEGYGFGGYGGGWGDAPRAVDGFDQSTATQICEQVEPSTYGLVEPETLSTCEAQEEKVEFAPLALDSTDYLTFCYDDGSPEAEIDFEKVTREAATPA